MATPPPPPPARPPHAVEAPMPAGSALDWESLVGVKLLSAVSGVALVLAALYFLRHSIRPARHSGRDVRGFRAREIVAASDTAPTSGASVEFLSPRVFRIGLGIAVVALLGIIAKLLKN